MSYTLKFLTELLHNKRTRNFFTTEYDPFISIYTNGDDQDGFEEREIAFKIADETLLIYLIYRIEGVEYFEGVYCIPYQQISQIIFSPCPELVLIPFTYKEFEELVQNSNRKGEKIE